MLLASLALRRFRNHGEQGEQMLSFSPGKNILLGKNGQGKTNLLEALYFLSHARSHRTASERELIRAGETGASVSVEVTPHRFESAIRLEAQWRLEDDRLKTLFKLNANPLRSRSQLLGHLPSVSFFNTDLLLLRGTPEDRRRWLDAAVTQYDKRHFTYVADFQKVRAQKSRLLKEPDVSPAHLAVWNQQLATTAARVMMSRIRYLQLIENEVMVQYLELSGGQEPLALSYVPASSLVPEPGDEAMEAALIQALECRAGEEIRRGICLVGPHRDDIRFVLGSLDACAYGSQGQQRSVVLALKLAELALLQAKLGEPPVLLLDDVMAELDPDRQQYLLDRIDPSIQVFLTTTHLDARLNPAVYRYRSDRNCAVYTVEGGTVVLQEGMKGNALA